MSPVGEDGLVSFHHSEQVGVPIADFGTLLPHGLVVLGEDLPHLGRGQIQEGASEPPV